MLHSQNETLKFRNLIGQRHQTTRHRDEDSSHTNTTTHSMCNRSIIPLPSLMWSKVGISGLAGSGVCDAGIKDM